MKKVTLIFALILGSTFMLQGQTKELQEEKNLEKQATIKTPSKTKKLQEEKNFEAQPKPKAATSSEAVVTQEKAPDKKQVGRLSKKDEVFFGRIQKKNYRSVNQVPQSYGKYLSEKYPGMKVQKAFVNEDGIHGIRLVDINDGPDKPKGLTQYKEPVIIFTDGKTWRDAKNFPGDMFAPVDIFKN